MSYFSEIPVIKTRRLTLRGHLLNDYDGCAAMWSDPNVTRHIGGKPSSPQQSWARMLSYLGHWRLMGFGYWAIEDNATGMYVGELGYADFKRDIQPSIRTIPEIGWALVNRVHGNGYATEAIRAAVSWGDDNLVTETTACIVNPENVASVHIAEKVGYHETHRTIYNDRPVTLFTRLRVH